jgi:serine protease AprX
MVGLMLVGIAEAGSSKGNQNKVSTDLNQKSQSATGLSQGLPLVSQGEIVDVIVQFKHKPHSEHFRKVEGLGGALERQLHSVKGGHFQLPLSAVQALASDPEVAYISPNRKTHTSSVDYYRQTVGADIANFNGWNGQGITVAVIDSGISDHPDLHDSLGNSRVIYNESFVSTESPADLFGHGTHVAGIIAGNGGSSQNDAYQVLGVSPNVYLVNLKVLDQNGTGTDAQTIAAIDRAIALKDQYNIRVINLSLSRGVRESYTLDPLCQAVEAAYQAGIVVVVAAGNAGRIDTQGINGYGTITAPGNDPYVITVGAANTRGTATSGDDLITTYSSKGPTVVDHIVKPDLVAPGHRITSLIDPNSTLLNLVPQAAVFSQTTQSNSYFMLSGTSMATPVVSGAAALLLQKDSTLSPDTVKGRLMATANKNFIPGYTWFDSTENANRYLRQDLFTIGAGYLNIPGALASTDIATLPAASPSVQIQSDGSVALSTNSALGGSNGWAPSTIWGTSNVAVSGSSVIWTIDGSVGTLDGSSVIWTFDGSDASLGGSSVIWTIDGSDAQSDEATSVVWTILDDGSDLIPLGGVL